MWDETGARAADASRANRTSSWRAPRAQGPCRARFHRAAPACSPSPLPCGGTGAADRGAWLHAVSASSVPVVPTPALCPCLPFFSLLSWQRGCSGGKRGGESTPGPNRLHLPQSWENWLAVNSHRNAHEYTKITASRGQNKPEGTSAVRPRAPAPPSPPALPPLAPAGRTRCCY